MSAEDKGLPAAEIVRRVERDYELARGTDGSIFAVPRSLRSARRATEIGALRAPVVSELFRADGKIAAPTTVAAAFETVKGLALSAPVQEVSLRAARVGSGLHIDLGTRDGTFVEVSPFGWEIRAPEAEHAECDTTTALDEARPVFRMTKASQPLPLPASGGSRDDLRRLLGLAEGDPRWLLVWGWLVAAFVEDVPRPLLWALGAQGSGKTTRTKMILDLVDPAERLGAPPGKSERDDSTAAYARFVPSWDNVGSVSAATSDWLCRLVTGVAVDRRALYTDDDLATRAFRRTGVATSIVLPYGLGPDALERMIVVSFDRVPDDERRSESGIRRRYESARPGILGAIFDDLAGVLRYLPRLQDAEERGEIGRLPRMADYAMILKALDIHTEQRLGFEDAYVDAVGAALAERAIEDPLITALAEVIMGKGGEWSGTMAALLTALADYAPLDPRTPWPRSAVGLGRTLTTQSESLRHAGIRLSDWKSGSKRGKRLDLITGSRAADAATDARRNSTPAVILGQMRDR